MKLIKISGAIEVLNLMHSEIAPYLTEEFFIALGENKTLKYLNMNSKSGVNNSTNISLLAKAVAMNAKRNGSLEALSIAGWFKNLSSFEGYFVKSLLVSDKDHELWYGDKKQAQEMKKE